MSGKTASVALRSAIRQGILGCPKTLTLEPKCPQPAALFIDLDEFEANLDRAKRAFGQGFLHAIAVKANPLHESIKICNQKAIGAECASIVEILNSLEAGIPPENIVYDCPVKTRPELEFALKNNLHINADNFQELEVISELMNTISDFKGVIGLRINPIMKAGDLKQLSVSTIDSKFAVAVTSSTREEVIGWFVKRPWMTCVHVHIGSQSYNVDALSFGAKAAVDLALEINKRVGRKQVNVIDIGGGLDVNRKDDSISPTFQDYADSLKKIVPELFPSQGIFRKVVTEFGQAFNAKTGWLASYVEYTKKIPDSEHTIALIHFGADMCLRTCYVPTAEKYKRRVEVFDGSGTKKTGKEVLHNIAGPLCFAGDVVSKEIMLPQIEKGDVVVLHDCGANSIALFSRHCSRQALSAFGYRVQNDNVQFQVLKEAETVDQLLAFWGGKRTKK